MEPIVSKSLPVSLNQHRSHGPFFFLILRPTVFSALVDRTKAWMEHANITNNVAIMYCTYIWCVLTRNAGNKITLLVLPWQFML